MSDWIPEQLKDAPYFKTPEGGESRTVEQVLADLTNASKLQGDMTSTHIRLPDRGDPDSVRSAVVKAMEHIPGLTAIPDGDDAEVRDAFLKSIGRPDAADKYTVPESVADGINLDSVREQAFADGWTQTQFDGFVNRMASTRQADSESLQAAIDTNLAEIKTDWGNAYPERHEQVKDFLSVDGVPDAIKQAFETGRLSSSEMKWLHGMANAVAGEDLQISGQHSASDNITPNEAAEALVGIESTLYAMKNTDPNYGAQVAKQERYLRAMRGENRH
jgi:hypothetical protein